MGAENIINAINTGFVPLVGVTEMKVYLLNEKDEPINPKTTPNNMALCKDGWRYRIETQEMDCREVLIGHIRDTLKFEDSLRGQRATYRVAIHPPRLGKGMPEDFIRYPTKAVPYLRMGNFETKAELFHKNPEVMAKWADVLVGILSVILDRNEATKRAFKEGYLEPGLFESIKERGIGYTFEYHSISSYWSRCPELVSIIMAHMRIAARLSLAEFQERKEINAFWEKTDHDEIRDIIQNHDFERALDIYNKLKSCMSYASVSSTDPMSYKSKRLDCLEYVIRKGIDKIWTSTNIAANFGDQNGWFTGMGGHTHTISAYFANQTGPSLDSIIMPENIEFLKQDKEPVSREDK